MIGVQYVVFGLAVGAVFALLASGIVLTYRASGVLNFAHASTGVAAAYLNFELLERFEWMPVGVALIAAMAFGAALGVAAQRLVFGPVADASQTVKLLVSFGLSGVIQGGIGLVFSRLGTPSAVVRLNTVLPLEDGVSLAGAAVPYQRVAVVVAGFGAALGLAAIVRRTEFGVQLRALAQNPLAARLAGVDDRRVEAITWALAGATAALAAVLIMPFGPFNPLALNGFQLKALAAALLGGFVSLPAALIGGAGLGVLQEVLVGAPEPLSGLRFVLAPAAILVLLLVRVERFFVSEQEARALEGGERIFDRGVRLPLVGSGRAWLAGAVAAAVVTLPLSGFWAFVTTRAALVALLALSLVVLTGWAGQVSLMPGTFAGVGACLAWVLDTRLGYDFAVVVPLAALATIPVCAVVGLAAVRLRPLYLAVATVALAGLFDDTLFVQDWFANGGRQMVVERPSYLAGDHSYATAVLLLVGGLFAFTACVGRSRTGRAFRMVRDNDRTAEASGVNPVKYRLLAFAVSAAYGGVMGALLAYLLGAFTTAEFSFLLLSLTAFGVAAVGGIRSPLGAVVGGFLFVEVTELFRTSGSVSDWSTLGVGAGIVVVMARSPDGLVGLAQRVLSLRKGRVPSEPDRVVLRAAPTPGRSHGGAGSIDGEELRRGLRPSHPPAGSSVSSSPALEVTDVSVRFGGLTAVSSVSLSVGPAEILGLIGPNGAGKTSLLDAVCAYVDHTGTVALGGQAIDRLLPYQRARRGLGRSFQDARLYPTMTVRDVLVSSFHARQRSAMVAEGLGLAAARQEEERMIGAAEATLDSVDLRHYLDHRVSELSFGTRRAVELALVTAPRPAVLLLDEPASGLQQSEVRVLGPMIEHLRGDAAVVLIDHDVPFVSAIAHRMVAMDLGRVIAMGSPDDVLHDPLVMRSYLGAAPVAAAP